jgi:beta-glucanase (GH16 family)
MTKLLDFKKNMKSKFALIAGLMMVMVGCGGSDDPSDDKVKLPTNLVVTVDVSDDGSGKVDVTTSATDANFYTINFGHGGSAVLATNGIASFIYTEAGDYTIEVKAHTTMAKFISESEEITVTLKEDTFIPATGYSTPASYPEMTLVWQDEFSGTSLNESDWTYEIGGSGWGNNELQYYRKENTSIVDGHLVITAKAENFGGRDYTSSRLITKGKKEFQYGRIDIRAALPKGQGIWPALWMLGANISEVPWPASGEIDIMEMIGGSNREKTVYGTLHWGANDTDQHVCTCDKPGYSLASGTFNDKFHVFTLIWDATTIKWYVDDELLVNNTIDITPAGLSEFHAKYFMIINLAVGGNWPGNPDGTTVLPQRLIVDYVRVFQKQ